VLLRLELCRFLLLFARGGFIMDEALGMESLLLLRMLFADERFSALLGLELGLLEE